jgi:hypothetical protein
MKSPGRWGLSILLSGLAFAALQPALAFDYPLSPEAIREAYFLATGDSARMAAAFTKYTQNPPAPKTGVHVSMIQFETPYLVVVQQIAQIGAGFYAPDAEQKFLGKPESCRVNVEVDYTVWQELEPPIVDGAFRFPTGAIGSDLSILLEQEKKAIAPQQVSHWGLLSGDIGGPINGVFAQLDYDAEKIDPAEPVKVKVFTPDGQQVEAEFDLANLR